MHASEHALVCVCVYTHVLLIWHKLGGGDLLSFETESRWVGAEGEDGCVKLGVTTGECEFLFMSDILVLDHSNII